MILCFFLFSFFSKCKYHLLIKFPDSLPYGTSQHVCFVSPVDESSEEIRGETREEQELGVVRSWMEVGGLLVLVEKEVQKLLQEVNPLFYLILI